MADEELLVVDVDVETLLPNNNNNNNNPKREKILLSNNIFYAFKKLLWVVSILNVTLWWFFYGTVSIMVTKDEFVFSKLLRLETVVCFAMMLIQYFNYYNACVNKSMKTPEVAKKIIPVITLLSITAFFLAMIVVRIDSEYSVWVDISLPTFSIFGLIFFQVWLYCLQMNTTTITWEMYTWKVYVISIGLGMIYLLINVAIQLVQDDFIPPYPFVFSGNHKTYIRYTVFFYVFVICYFLACLTIFFIHLYYKTITYIRDRLKDDSKKTDTIHLQNISEFSDDESLFDHSD